VAEEEEVEAGEVCSMQSNLEVEEEDVEEVEGATAEAEVDFWLQSKVVVAVPPPAEVMEEVVEVCWQQSKAAEGVAEEEETEEAEAGSWLRFKPAEVVTDFFLHVVPYFHRRVNTSKYDVLRRL
jgi:hypothetical protein